MFYRGKDNEDLGENKIIFGILFYHQVLQSI